MCFASGGASGPRAANENLHPLYANLPNTPRKGMGFGVAMENRAEAMRRMTSPTSVLVQRGSVSKKPLTPQETEQMRSERAAWASRERTGKDPYRITPSSRQAKIAQQSPQQRLILARRGAGGTGGFRGL